MVRFLPGECRVGCGCSPTFKRGIRVSLLCLLPHKKNAIQSQPTTITFACRAPSSARKATGPYPDFADGVPEAFVVPRLAQGDGVELAFVQVGHGALPLLLAQGFGSFQSVLKSAVEKTGRETPTKFTSLAPLAPMCYQCRAHVSKAPEAQHKAAGRLTQVYENTIFSLQAKYILQPSRTMMWAPEHPAARAGPAASPLGWHT